MWTTNGIPTGGSLVARHHAHFLPGRTRPGTYQVWSRTVDDLGRSQPLDGSIYWNPNAYEWNGVHKIGVTVKS